MVDELPLFEIRTEDNPASRRQRLTASQRSTIATLFAELGISLARDQFALIKEATGLSISRALDLDESAAQTAIHALRARVQSMHATRTGDAWTDRTDDTWLDKM